MAVGPRSRLGPYEIRERLGGGGMGEVYRAHDTRLDRTVAIKVIAADRITDPQARVRFEREARAIAALNHPHICHLNDIGQHDSVDFLVMEYIEGRDAGRTPCPRRHGASFGRDAPARNRDRRSAGRCPSAEHRSSRSEAEQRHADERRCQGCSTSVSPSARRAIRRRRPRLGSTLAAPRKEPLTDEGSILGTWQYMAPEQIDGQAVDTRADIFAFGAVMYEMATGRRAFEGDSHASLIAAILEREPPPINDRQPAAPSGARPSCAQMPGKGSGRALAERARSHRRAEVDCRRPRVISAGGQERARVRPRLASDRGHGHGCSASALALAPPSPGTCHEPPRFRLTAPVRRFAMQPADEGRLAVPQPRFDISPDGRALVYTADRGSGVSLYLRPFDQWAGRLVPGTERAYEMAFSPDGLWIAFVTDGGAIRKVSATSNTPPVTLAEAAGVLDQSIGWLSNDTIVFGQLEKGLAQIPADGGAMVRMTTPDRGQGELDHHFPRRIPGRNALLLTRHLKSNAEAFDIAVLQLDTGTVKVIVPDGFDARYVSTGHLRVRPRPIAHGGPVRSRSSRNDGSAGRARRARHE